MNLWSAGFGQVFGMAALVFVVFIGGYVVCRVAWYMLCRCIVALIVPPAQRRRVLATLTTSKAKRARRAQRRALQQLPDGALVMVKRNGRLVRIGDLP